MKYVIAVSGGVDSMVLLDALVHERLSELTSVHDQRFTIHELIVAHFDHGIRSDSASDEAWVRGVVGEYGLRYESQRVELGPEASEATAREMRYNFLRQCCKKYNALLITAHHQDDLLETIIINLIRGTGWRGLAPMVQIPNPKSQIPSNNQKSIIKNHIRRPLLGTSKVELLKYAKKHGIEWREDNTNQDQTYLRNYIRHTLIPKMLQKDPKALEKLLRINQQAAQLQNKIATELQKYLIKYQISNIKYVVPRYDLIMPPSPVAQEIIYTLLTRLDRNWHPSRQQIERSLHFIKSGLPHKTLKISGSLELRLSERQVQFKKC